jgi:predicted RNA-binding Zn-ribbon protein involved in translation (DUF1610 family)
MFLSVWDIIYEMQWIQNILATYGILTILIIVLILLKTHKRTASSTSQEFKKRYFRCPSCKGIFAIKKSRYTPATLTCPECGKAGKIPSSITRPL